MTTSTHEAAIPVILPAAAANHGRGTHTLPPRPGTLRAQRLKVTTAINAAELAAIPTLRIRLPDRTLTAEIAAKSMSKAQAAIREVGSDNIALVLQGRLIADDVITEAGLSAQPRQRTHRKLPDAHAPTAVTMGHAFGVSDERVQSTRRRYAETWPIFCSKVQRGIDDDRSEGDPAKDHADDRCGAMGGERR